MRGRTQARIHKHEITCAFQTHMGGAMLASDGQLMAGEMTAEAGAWHASARASGHAPSGRRCLDVGGGAEAVVGRLHVGGVQGARTCGASMGRASASPSARRACLSPAARKTDSAQAWITLPIGKRQCSTWPKRRRVGESGRGREARVELGARIVPAAVQLRNRLEY